MGCLQLRVCIPWSRACELKRVGWAHSGVSLLGHAEYMLSMHSPYLKRLGHNYTGSVADPGIPGVLSPQPTGQIQPAQGSEHWTAGEWWQCSLPFPCCQIPSPMGTPASWMAWSRVLDWAEGAGMAQGGIWAHRAHSRQCKVGSRYTGPDWGVDPKDPARGLGGTKWLSTTAGVQSRFPDPDHSLKMCFQPHVLLHPTNAHNISPARRT